MRLNQTMKKLQRAILANGFVIALNTTQFYSKEQQRFITIYILCTPISQQNRYGEWKDKDYQIMRSASAVDVLFCLQDIYKAVREWRS